VAAIFFCRRDAGLKLRHALIFDQKCPLYLTFSIDKKAISKFIMVAKILLVMLKVKSEIAGESELTLNPPPVRGQASLAKRGTNVPLLFLREGVRG